MDMWVWIAIIAVAVVLAAGIGAWAYKAAQHRRTEGLRDRFGPEYDRALEGSGDRRAAERELQERQERVEKLKLRPLSADERNGFGARWKETQAHFVDEPADALEEADRLVQEAMRARGFPTGGDFDQRAADVSVEHPYVVEHYRAAHDVAARVENGDVDTEELRTAMVHYRSLFDDLVNAPGDVPAMEAPRSDAAKGAQRGGNGSTHRQAGRLGNIQRRG